MRYKAVGIGWSANAAGRIVTRLANGHIEWTNLTGKPSLYYPEEYFNGKEELTQFVPYEHIVVNQMLELYEM